VSSDLNPKEWLDTLRDIPLWLLAGAAITCGFILWAEHDPGWTALLDLKSLPQLARATISVGFVLFTVLTFAKGAASAWPMRARWVGGLRGGPEGGKPLPSLTPVPVLPVQVHEPAPASPDSEMQEPELDEGDPLQAVGIHETKAQQDLLVSASHFWASLNTDAPTVGVTLFVTNLAVRGLNVDRVVVTYFLVSANGRSVDVRTGFVRDHHFVLSAKAMQEVYVERELSTEYATRFANLDRNGTNIAQLRVDVHARQRGGEPFVYQSENLRCLGTIDRKQEPQAPNSDPAPTPTVPRADGIEASARPGTSSSAADERELAAYAEIGPALAELERHLADWRKWSKSRPDAVEVGLLKTAQEHATTAYENYATVISARATVLPSEVTERLEVVLVNVRGEIHERSDPTAIDSPIHSLEVHKAMLAAVEAIEGARRAMQSRLASLRGEAP
jgi:hypothetical protein